MAVGNQAWQITAPGTLTLNELGPVPTPGPKQVLVRIAAVALNFRDKLVIEHSPDYPLKTGPNLIPGSDGAGIVEGVGSSSSWKKGDRVIIHPSSWFQGTDGSEWKFEETMGGGTLDGTFRRWMVVDDARLIRAPDGLPLEEAAGMFTAGVTAYRALFYGGVELKPGVTVLTQGTGGVSSYGILIAAAAGATVIATLSSDEKLKVAQQLGAKHLINYSKRKDWAAEVLRVTDGKGVNLVLDVVGAGSMEQTMKATTQRGTIVVTGLLDEDRNKKVDIVMDILYGAKSIIGQLGAGSRIMAEELSAFLEKHQLHPPTAATFDFEDMPQALKALDKMSKPGKIIVKC